MTHVAGDAALAADVAAAARRSHDKGSARPSGAAPTRGDAAVTVAAAAAAAAMAAMAAAAAATATTGRLHGAARLRERRVKRQPPGAWGRVVGHVGCGGTTVRGHLAACVLRACCVRAACVIIRRFFFDVSTF